MPNEKKKKSSLVPIKIGHESEQVRSFVSDRRWDVTIPLSIGTKGPASPVANLVNAKVAILYARSLLVLCIPRRNDRTDSVTCDPSERNESLKPKVNVQY